MKQYHELTETQQQIAKQQGYNGFVATPESAEHANEAVEVYLNCGAVMIGLMMLQNYNAISKALEVENE